jgi:phage terminase small subunit
MSVLKNPRHEAFAQALARGVPAAKAYVDAGYKPNRGNACALKQAAYSHKQLCDKQLA